MNRNEVKDTARDIIRRKRHDDIHTFLETSDQPEIMVSAILYSLGFIYVLHEELENRLEFFAGHAERDMSHKLSIIRTDKGIDIDGTLSDLMEKIFCIANAIEHDTGEWIYLPNEIRQLRIRQFCDNLDVSQYFFQTVLANWN